MLAFRCSCVLYAETLMLSVAWREYMVQNGNRNEPCVGPAPASQPCEHKGCKTLYILCTDFLLFFFLLLFYFPRLKSASGRCHSLRSVNCLLPIKMQIHTSMQCMMDLGKLWSFLTILYWFHFNLNCLSKLSLFLEVLFPNSEFLCFTLYSYNEIFTPVKYNLIYWTFTMSWVPY